jgi:hypothetical protein
MFLHRVRKTTRHSLKDTLNEMGSLNARARDLIVAMLPNRWATRVTGNLSWLFL